MSAEKKKELQVAALENGTAIDHIPPTQLFKVASLLGLENMDNTITIGNNLLSSKMGSKGMIKISDKFFCDEEISRIALIAPNVILNEIRDYEVVEKRTVTLPDKLIGLVKCNNPKCITNNEPMATYFDVIDKEKGTIKCHYCERKINKEDIEMFDIFKREMDRKFEGNHQGIVLDIEDFKYKSIKDVLDKKLRVADENEIT